MSYELVVSDYLDSQQNSDYLFSELPRELRSHIFFLL